MVKLYVGPIWTRFYGLAEYDIKQLTERLAFRPLNYYFTPRYQSGDWDGWIRLFYTKRGNHFTYTGLVPRILKIFKADNVDYEIIKEYSHNNVEIMDTQLSNITLRGYQLEIIETCKSKKRGIIKAATGAGKCFAKGTKILMYDGTTKNIENVIVGDLVMGMDSQPRTITSLSHGRELMYEIIPTKGDSYTVNASHILSLKYTNLGKNKKQIQGQIVDIGIQDYIRQSNSFKHITKGFRVGVEFPEQILPKYLSPYFLGLWLGDGRSNWCAISCPDKEVVDYLQHYSKIMGGTLYIDIDQRNTNSNSYRIKFLPRGKNKHLNSNPIINELRHFNLINNKHIPNIYKINNRHNRLQLLAGLIDTDGHLDKNCYEIITKFDALKDDILFLARSLGLAAYVKKCIKGIKSTDFKTEYWRIIISGDIDEIPVLIKRKKAQPRRQKKNVLVTGIAIKEKTIGNYYGFEIKEEDKHFLLSDFTVVHNTEIIIKLISDINLKSLIIVNRSTLFRQTVEKIKKRLGLRDSEINYIGDVKNYNSDNKITVATFQSLLTKDKETDKLLYEQVLKNTGIIIVDEAHHISANELGNLLKIANKTLYRFGFTATPEREDGYDMMIEAMIGPLIYDLPISKLIQMGFLSKPKIYFLRQEYDSGITNMKKHDNSKYIKATKAIFNQQQRNENMIKIAMKFAEKGKLVLISFAKVEHLNNVYKILKEMNTNFKIKKVTGKDTANTKEQTINKMKEREYDIVLATLFGEGVDVENLDVLINARASKSEIDVYQQVGRVVRLSPGKKPVVIDFLDYDPAIKDDKKKKLKDYFKSYSNKKIKLLKSEPEFEVEVIDTIEQIKELED